MVPPFAFDALVRERPVAKRATPFAAPIAASPLAASPIVVAPVDAPTEAATIPAAARLNPPTPPTPRSERHKAPRRQRTSRERTSRHRGRPILIVAVVLVAAVAFVGFRLSQPIPKAKVSSALGAAVKVPASTVSLPWAPTGQSAVAVPALGIDVTSGPEQSVPIASLTKMMTAYIILHDHPLAGSQSGPNITMTQADVDYFNTDTVSDQANAQVTVGEVLTERQLLGGLLVHSANNYALSLARWDAGSLDAFVAKMNATAHTLGMDNTHYVDPSGYDEGSQSTAGDLLKVAMPDMTNATFASIVRMPNITLPVAGTISTYTPLLGIQGVIGVKSGFTTLAGGCDVLAVRRVVNGKSVLIISAVTGQTGPNVLVAAGLQALNVANVTGMSIGATPVQQSGTVVARVAAAGHVVDAVTAAPVTVLSWPGVTITRTFEPGAAVAPGTRQGTRIGREVVTVGTQRVVIPVRLQKDLPKESISQRIF
jgi:D-alanyl-D-alanine carboxypeptidase (penicillin-binding protein 5/6)